MNPVFALFFGLLDLWLVRECYLKSKDVYSTWKQNRSWKSLHAAGPPPPAPPKVGLLPYLGKTHPPHYTNVEFKFKPAEATGGIISFDQIQGWYDQQQQDPLTPKLGPWDGWWWVPHTYAFSTTDKDGNRKVFFCLESWTVIDERDLTNSFPLIGPLGSNNVYLPLSGDKFNGGLCVTESGQYCSRDEENYMICWNP